MSFMRRNNSSNQHDSRQHQSFKKHNGSTSQIQVDMAIARNRQRQREKMEDAQPTGRNESNNASSTTLPPPQVASATTGKERKSLLIPTARSSAVRPVSGSSSTANRSHNKDSAGVGIAELFKADAGERDRFNHSHRNSTAAVAPVAAAADASAATFTASKRGR